MTRERYRRVFALLALVSVASGCQKREERHQHASEHAEGHDHHAEGHGHGDTPMVRVTTYSERFELFAEHPPAIAGQDVSLIAHLTVLDGFRPLTDAAVELELDGATPMSAKAPKAERPGIYRLTFRAKAPGRYQGRIVTRGPVEGTVGGFEVLVHENAEKARSSTPDDEHGPGTIEFLKEQQWGVPFRTVFAETGRLVASLEVAGTVDTPPGGSAEVGAPVAGRLVPLATGLPKPGDAVKKGQALASLQPAPSSPEDAARATFAVSEAEARAVAARVAVERAERLIKEDAISLRELEDSRREAAVAEQAVRAARRLEGVFSGASAGTGGAVWRLVAPIDGTLVSVAATPGATASPGQVLFRIVDTRELWIRGRVPEQDAPRIRSDRDAFYRVTGTENWAPIHVTGADATAGVVSVGRVVDPLSRTVDVLYSLRTPDPNLRVGGLVQVSIPAGDDFSGVVVPATALVENEGRQAVYVQLDGEHFVERPVRTGPRAGERVGSGRGTRFRRAHRDAGSTSGAPRGPQQDHRSARTHSLMIERLLRLSLRHRWLVLGLAAALFVVGAYRSLEMPVDVFPDLTAPRVTVVTESTGMAPEEVERLITLPIETAVNGASGVRRVRSGSAPGISIVWVEFDWNASVADARQRVTERLQGLQGTLPPEASPPSLAPASSVMGEIAFVALTSERASSIELRRSADVDVRRRLLAVEGVSQVVAIGGDEKQYQVLADPHRLERYRLTLAELVASLETGSQNTPGGYVVDGGQESVVRILGRASAVSDLEAIVVAVRDGVSVRVRDVANVRIGAAVARGAASYRGQPAVILSVVKQPHADTVSTTRRVELALDVLERELRPKAIRVHRDVFRQQDFIDTAIANVVRVLRDGAVLVVLVLLLFLWSIRPTLISLVAIPLSLVTAVLALDVAGLTIDTMTLGGLAIAIGELVDDAIVNVENVTRRLRERAQGALEPRASILETVLHASLEIRSSIVSATYVLMLVFVPLLLLEGLEGRLLRPLAISYLVAVFASLIVAVTVTPVLCAFLLPREIERRGAREPPFMAFLQRRYEPLLALSLKHSGVVIGASLLLVIAGGAALWGAGRSFLPEFNEGSLTINMVLRPGTPLAESDALAKLAERALLADRGVLSVGRRTGRAERDEHVLGVETSELEVKLKPEDPRTKEQLFADVRERLKVVPGAQFEIGQPISHRIEHMISGQRSMLAIKVFGDDLRQLRRVAEQVKGSIAGVPGLVDIGVEQVVDIPQLVVRVDAQAASNYGLSAGDAAASVSTALWGKTPSTVYEEGMTTDVVVKYDAKVLESAEGLRRTLIPTPVGALVPVSALAEVLPGSGPNYILRENVERRMLVTVNVAGRDIRGAFEDVRRRIQETIKPPSGVRIEYAGQFEREEAAGRRLLLFGALSVLGIAAIVATTLRSLGRALIVLVNLPLALAGGVVGVYLAGGVLSVATTIGFITLFGIATRNGILLATRTRDLELDGVERVLAVTRAARERLSPILMTALTAGLGLLPLALALGRPGSEIQAPMALVILTGLASSTFLNMLVVPVLFVRFGGRAPTRAHEGAS